MLSQLYSIIYNKTEMVTTFSALGHHHKFILHNIVDTEYYLLPFLVTDKKLFCFYQKLIEMNYLKHKILY